MALLTKAIAQTHDSQKETRLPIPFVGDVQPLAFVFQKANRKPGWYYQRTNRGNEMSTFLEYPNEKMHKSVRLRYGKDNLGAFGWGVFDPYALNKWAPQQGKDGRWSWVWNGWTSCPNSPLMEAKIRKDGWEERIRGLLNFGITEPEEAVQIEQTGTFVKTLFSQFARDG